MNTDEQYVPSEEEVAEHYIRNTLNPVADRAEFDRWLAAHDARVRRDAAREALDGLAAAEHRIARLEAQTAIRGRAVVMYRERAREAEARVKAVQDLIDQADMAGDWNVTCSRLQWAIDGTTPNRASEGK